MTKQLRPNRFDNMALTLGKNVKETPQGFLEIPAYTARTGIQRYRLADGSMLNEYRPEEEVFSDSSMSSLRTACVTNGHPTEMVNPKNAKDLIVGHTDGYVEKKKEGVEFYLGTNLIITHQEAIDAIRAGKAQLSNGYHVDLDFTPGEYNNQKYDAVQRNIVNNHIAIVWKGRAGDNVTLKLDSDDAVLINDEDINNNEGKETMKIKIGDKEFDVSDEMGKAFNAFMSKKKEKGDADEAAIAALTVKNDELKDEVEVLKTSKSRLTAKVDSLETEKEKLATPKMDKEEFNKAVKERIAVVDCASKMLTKEEIEKLDSLENIEIKKLVIKADSPKTDEEKLKDENYVNARYDMVVENLDSSAKAKEQIGKTIVKTREDGTDENKDYMTPEQIRKHNMDEAQKSSMGNQE